MIERLSDGTPSAIISPYGHRTELGLNENGYIGSVLNPAGEASYYTYWDGGLMQTKTDPKEYVYRYTYDSLGRVIRESDPAGGFQTLFKSKILNGYQVTLTSGLGKENVNS